MKFILLVEEDGYQVRYWDQINEEIGDCIAVDWKPHKLHSKLISKGFNINEKTLKEAVHKLDKGPEPFVVLRSELKSIVNLDTFINDLFVIDNEE